VTFKQMAVRTAMLIWVLFVTASSQAFSQTMVGTGARSYGAWTKDRRDSVFSTVNDQWVFGYLSGANDEIKSPDFLKLTDSSAIVAWINNYCASHPLDKIFAAATALKNELKSRAASK
jgi:hypothetical protein